MPARRLSVRKIKEMLRLKASGKSNRKIAVSCGIGRSTVADYLQRAADAGLVWPLSPELSDAAIEQRLFPPPPTRANRADTTGKNPSVVRIGPSQGQKNGVP